MEFHGAQSPEWVSALPVLARFLSSLVVTVPLPPTAFPPQVPAPMEVSRM